MAKKKNVRTYKRGSTWTYCFETASVDGRRKPVTKGGFPTEADAYKAGLSALADYANGVKRKEPVTISYKAFLSDWMQKVYIHEVKEKSFNTIKTICDKHIIPELGGIRLTELSHIRIKEFLNKKTSEGYSKSTITLMRSVITRTLQSAIIDYEYLSTNPAKGIKIPREAQKRAPRKRVALSKDAQLKILSFYDKDHPAYLAMLLGLHCGLRIGEAFGLCWDDVDFNNKTISINKQMVIGKGRFFIDEPKYNSSRVISADDMLLRTLSRFRKRQLEDRLKDPEYPKTLLYEDLRSDGVLSPFDLIMRLPNGDAFKRTSMMTLIYKMRAELDIPFDFHTLRHTHCTDMITCGAPLKAIQKRLGHKDISITLNIYTEVSEQMEDTVKEIINQDLYAEM